MTPLDMVFGKLHQTNSFGEIKIIKYTTSFEISFHRLSVGLGMLGLESTHLEKMAKIARPMLLGTT